MNEQVDLTHAQVYQDYAVPGRHPGLLRPMRRLAAGKVMAPIAVERPRL